jgi:adenylate cyclase
VVQSQGRYLSPLAREPPWWSPTSLIRAAPSCGQRYVEQVEIERKFLVPDPPPLEGTSSDPVEQGYLSLGTEGEVRLRRRGDALVLTVKRGAGLVRDEQEVELSPDQFDALWPLTEGRRLRKRRHLVEHEGREIELDVYEGELDGLAVAEVEFEHEAEAESFEPPTWFGEEVTGDEGYINETLAVRGLPSSALTTRSHREAGDR